MTNAYKLGSQSSPYGWRIHPQTGEKEFHAGQDFKAQAGTPIPAATSGEVIYSGLNKGFGNVVIVKNSAGGYSLYAHMQDGDRAQLGQRIWPGDILGRVGSTGNSTGPHLHYSVIKKEAGQTIEKSKFPRDGGSIGIKLNENNTIDPAGYDPTPPYLEETRRATQMMSGTDASPTSGDTPSDRPDLFGDRFGKWSSSPAGNAPLATSDYSDSFNDRFGNWGSTPAGDFGNPRSPLLRALQDYRGSDAPASTSAQAAHPTTSALQPNFPSQESAFSDRSENGPGGPRPDTYPRLQRVSPAFPDITPRTLSDPVPPQSGQTLGIFSGKPLPQTLLPPSIWGLPDNSDTSDAGNWFTRLGGVTSQNPTQPAPSLDNSLRGLYRDDPLQPWFVQRQR
jgi:hypothetical protein